jgi:extracellular factor (EF) 3-hydroxypalmitic acid methyl ester biosynthesis protein
MSTETLIQLNSSQSLDVYKNKISEILMSWKQLMLQSETEIRLSGSVLQTTEELVLQVFHRFSFILDEILGNKTTLSADNHQQLSMWVRAEFLPYTLISNFASRAFLKPLGYAGDYLTIQSCYDNSPNGPTVLGSLIDKAFLSLSAVNAVQNRRIIVKNLIKDFILKSNQETVHITSIASGPAQELIDLLIESPELIEKATFNLIDIDMEALYCVHQKINQTIKDYSLNKKLKKRFNLIPADIMSFFKSGTLPVQNQDLIYAIGISDYFEEDAILFLTKLMVSSLIKTKVGSIILGNFAPSKCDAIMRSVSDWNLIVRNPEDFLNIIKMASPKDSTCRLITDDTKIQIFVTMDLKPIP